MEENDRKWNQGHGRNQREKKSGMYRNGTGSGSRDDSGPDRSGAGDGAAAASGCVGADTGRDSPGGI